MYLRKTERKPGFSSNLFIALMLLVFTGVALYLRVAFVYGDVFTPNWIKFTGNDAYFQMRLVDTIVNNFPHLANFDPYLQFPGGMVLNNIHLFNWLLASIAWVVGLGSPTEHTVDVIGVYFPAVLGALTILPVYFVGKELFGRWAGLISAALLTILPGEFLGRSILGFTDQHVAETFLTATAMLFLILAIKSARQSGLSFTHLATWNWAAVAKPLVYSLLAGFFLGLYILTWIGALLFVFVVGVYLLVQFVIDHLWRRSTDYLSVTGAILFLVSLLVVVPFSPGILTIGSLGIALLIPLVLGGLSRLMTWKGLRPAYYPAVVVGLGLAGAALLYVSSPSFFRSMLDAFGVFAPSATLRATLEAQAFLFPGGTFSLAVAWGNFTTSFFLSIISLAILIYLVVRRGDPDKTLLVVWSLVILAATLAQRRFAYYFVVNVAVLTGYLLWRVLELAGAGELIKRATQQRTGAASRRSKQKRRSSQNTASYLIIALVAVVIFFVAFFWNIPKAVEVVSSAPFAPSNAWCSSLSWLKDNSPEPFGDAAAYYQLPQLPTGEPYQYPESAYGVMAWWDYGYWITRIGHRIPNANPGQDPQAVTKVATYFTAQDESSGSKIAQEVGTGYVVMDYETVTSKFWAVATWAGKSPAEFFNVYWSAKDNSQKLYIYPEYYRSLAVRLYNFDGKAVTPTKSVVISYQDGEVLSEKEFSSYEEAESYISSQKSGNYRIVGTDPMVSPVPLEELQHYKLVYSSEDLAAISNTGQVPAIKIFEFTDRAPLYGR
jgi:oligosaccharyl transferase (archaeosortase A-associated)